METKNIVPVIPTGYHKKRGKKKRKKSEGLIEGVDAGGQNFTDSAT
jgi:hypothetical protein